MMPSEAEEGLKDACPACGGSVGCGMANGAATCWCFALPHAMPMASHNNGTRCYCRSCLTKLIEDRAASSSR
jgi:Cysteine-rich CWC